MQKFCNCEEKEVKFFFVENLNFYNIRLKQKSLKILDNPLNFNLKSQN